MGLDYNSIYSRTVAAHRTGGSTNYMISASNGYLYNICVGPASDIMFRKSIDHGISWGYPVKISGAISATQLSVWYDGWSNIPDGLIHVAYVESVSDDVLYARIDTLNDDDYIPSSVAYSGSSTAANATLSICRAYGGNLYIVYNIDGGVEDGFVTSSINTGSTWTAGTFPIENAADHYMLMPGWNVDTNDVQLFFWDISTNEISVKRYDASADSWAETLISTGMAELSLTTAWPNFCAVPNFSGSNNILAAWSNTDAAGAKLRCWEVTDTSYTELTNIVPNSSGEQGLVALTIDTGSSVWYAYYTGKSDGSEVWSSRVNVYYKTSSDFGTSWGPETKFSTFISGSSNDSGADIRWLATNPIGWNSNQYVSVYDNSASTHLVLRTIGSIPTGSNNTVSSATGGSITFA